MHSVHVLPRARVLLGEGAPLAALAAAALVGSRALALVLAVAAGVVAAWSLVTLHFPHRVELTDSGVSFHAYGRAHAYPWREVECITVRRVLVRDRALVRIAPSPPWRGRYWLTDSLGGFADLVAELERRAGARGAVGGPARRA
jgi:hypothetical protein